MLSTALEILEATKSSVFDDEIMGLAGELHTRRNELSDEAYAKYLFMYSSALSAKVADLVTKVLLTETQFKEMIEALDEMDNLSEEIFEELGE
jgi:uncharacterized protein (UPF0305 family)